MFVFRSIGPLQARLDAARKSGRQIGFVPTMGALHDGHTTLVQRSIDENDITAVSIFVNPTQFNDASDLERYPRPVGTDLDILFETGCDVVFLPAAKEVYPPGLDTELDLDFEGLDSRMEGEFRPGHFKGVAQVVYRLLDIVQPDRLYMGQKDFQQTAIIGYMLDHYNLPVELVVCPTVREPDGLALSSRNTLLTSEFRKIAPVIYRTLVQAGFDLGTKPMRQIEQEALEALSQAGLEPEYFSIVNRNSLLPATDQEPVDGLVACVAAFAGEVRLIDNLPLGGASGAV